MKTLEDFKNEVAVKYGHKSFIAFKNKCIKENITHSILDMIALLNEASMLYIKYVEEEIIKKCANAAKTKVVSDFEVLVDKNSILNVERITK